MSNTSSAKELAELVQQFLSHQVENNSQLSSGSKESLAVAAECIEQAFEFQRRPASDELLCIYEGHKRAAWRESSAPTNQPAWPNVFPDLMAQVFNMAAGGADNQAPQAATTASTTSTQATPTPVPKVRKKPTPAEMLAADSFKNQGNEHMREDKFKEAHECYTRAIEIDDNNAIYYSNRAAASSKLGNHHAALRDCEEAIEIDPTYSKAYGRKALAHASLDEHQKAKECYARAVELDPNNESYRNNLRIAEEKLVEESANANSSGGQQNLMANMMRLMNNTEFMQMATRSLQDPRLRTLIGSAMANLSPQVGGAQANPAADTRDTEVESQPTQQHNQQAQPQARQVSPQSVRAVNDLLNMTSSLAGTSTARESAQTLISMLASSSPNGMDNLTQMISGVLQPPAAPSSQTRPDNDLNPPPGYS